MKFVIFTKELNKKKRNTVRKSLKSKYAKYKDVNNAIDIDHMIPQKLCDDNVSMNLAAKSSS